MPLEFLYRGPRRGKSQMILIFRLKKHIRELYNTDYKEHARVICVDEFGSIEVRQFLKQLRPSTISQNNPVHRM
jgi:hypothetical protein